MNNVIIGVTGFARSGKDTFFKESSKLLSKAQCHRYAFADALKHESDDFLKKNVGISAFTDAEDKELIRPFLVTYGTELRRKIDPIAGLKKLNKPSKITTRTLKIILFLLPMCALKTKLSGSNQLAA